MTGENSKKKKDNRNDEHGDNLSLSQRTLRNSLNNNNNNNAVGLTETGPISSPTRRGSLSVSQLRRAPNCFSFCYCCFCHMLYVTQRERERDSEERTRSTTSLIAHKERCKEGYTTKKKGGKKKRGCKALRFLASKHTVMACCCCIFFFHS